MFLSKGLLILSLWNSKYDKSIVLLNPSQEIILSFDIISIAEEEYIIFWLKSINIKFVLICLPPSSVVISMTQIVLLNSLIGYIIIF